MREGFAARFAGLPDVHYLADSHWVSGDRGVPEWTLTGTTTEGERVEVRGCDLWTFRDGHVTRKGSYWKIVTGRASSRGARWRVVGRSPVRRRRRHGAGVTAQA